jgi:hypothetical protein
MMYSVLREQATAICIAGTKESSNLLGEFRLSMHGSTTLELFQAC